MGMDSHSFEWNREGMFKRENLPKTALITNGMVWFGLALFFAGIAGEQTWNGFHGQWYNIVGWVIITAAAIGTATIGVLETRRLRARMKSHTLP